MNRVLRFNIPPAANRDCVNGNSLTYSIDVLSIDAIEKFQENLDSLPVKISELL